MQGLGRPSHKDVHEFVGGLTALLSPMQVHSLRGVSGCDYGTPESQLHIGSASPLASINDRKLGGLAAHL